MNNKSKLASLISRKGKYHSKKNVITNSAHRLSIIALILILPSINSYADLPRRIASLKPNITATLIAIDARDQIVGITRHCRWEGDNRPPTIADYLSPKIEAVLATHPDLIITSKENSIKEQIHALQKLGLTVAVLNFDTLYEIADSIIKVGQLTGHSDRAMKIAAQISEISHIRCNYPAKRVLVIVGTRPIIAAGHKTYLGELIERACGINIAPMGKRYPRISAEQLATLKPQIIFNLSSNDLHVPNMPVGTCVIKLVEDDFQPGPQIISSFAVLREAMTSRCK